MKMKPTIYDIAKASNFSRSTVSRVITNDPRVDPKTRDAIKKIIKEMNFKPSSIARSLVKGSTDIISLIVGDITNPFYVEISKTIQEILFHYGYMTVLCNSDYNIEMEDKYLDTSMDKHFSGICMMSATGSESKLQEAVDNGIPVVLINRYSPAVNTDAILVDDYKGAYAAIQYLVGLGHKRIALLNGPKRSTASENTKNGYISMMNEAGLAIMEGDIMEGDLTSRSGYVAGKFLLENKKDITAVLCTTDAMAVGLIEAYSEAGKAVPDDISVIGYDRSKLSV